MRDPAFDPPQDDYQPEPKRAAALRDSAGATPSMAQFLEIKAANPDCILFYRMGDFYELFFEDAEIASQVLGIVLTRRGKHAGEDIPMCGVPVVRADDYLQRLIARGLRVAVCEQLEDPAEARKRGSKAVVKRDVVRIITPGTIFEENLLEPGRANRLVALARGRGPGAGGFALAAVDVSTGDFRVLSCADHALLATLARLDPREILAPEMLCAEGAIDAIARQLGAALTPLARDGFDPASAEQRLCAFFGVTTLDGFGRLSELERVAAAAIVVYLERTQRGAHTPLTPPRAEVVGTTMEIDAATRANLEITRTIAGQRAGSLLGAIDRTLTAPGGRLLADRLAAPSRDKAEIDRRLDAVAFLVDDPDLCRALRQGLRRMPDTARALTRLGMDRAGPRDLALVREALVMAPEIARLFAPFAGLPAEIAEATAAFGAMPMGLAETLARALAEELPLQKRDGRFIAPGFDAALDAERALATDSRALVAALQERYGIETKCRTARIKHNNFLGFYLEVPANVGETLLAPPLNATFIHRQTMAGAMRFSSSELAALEQKIAGASERALALELAHYDALCAAIVAEADRLAALSRAVAVLDVAAALAHLAQDRAYIRPVLLEDCTFSITGGRHPVVEDAVRTAGAAFIGNDCDLGAGRDPQILLVTGPNMAGKSTYLRQNALIAILAQTGSFVPAASARIGLVDRLFSRVGASDDLARGRSTFMVEMVETAAILNLATASSLVVLDEIGRGTATFDGLSIALATVEHLHETIRCRALFATHYHELTRMTERLARLRPVTMRVAEYKGDLVFLHEVVPGAADRSYGIQVARLAGLPKSVLARARAVLKDLEQGEGAARGSRMAALPLFDLPPEAPMVTGTAEPDLVHRALADIDPDALTPREALEALYRLKGLLPPS